MSYHILVAAVVVLAIVAAFCSSPLALYFRAARLTRALDQQVDLRSTAVIEFLQRRTNHHNREKQ